MVYTVYVLSGMVHVQCMSELQNDERNKASKAEQKANIKKFKQLYEEEFKQLKRECAEANEAKHALQNQLEEEQKLHQLLQEEMESMRSCTHTPS